MEKKQRVNCFGICVKNCWPNETETEEEGTYNVYIRVYKPYYDPQILNGTITITGGTLSMILTIGAINITIDRFYYVFADA